MPVNYFCAFRNGIPAVELAYALVRLRRIMLVFGNDLYCIRNGSKNIWRESETEEECIGLRGITVFIRIRERNHVFGQNFWNPADTRGHDV